MKQNADPKSKPPARRWNQLIHDAIKVTNTSLPLAARARAMVQTAIKLPKKTASPIEISQFGTIMKPDAVKRTISRRLSVAGERTAPKVEWLRVKEGFNMKQSKYFLCLTFHVFTASATLTFMMNLQKSHSLPNKMTSIARAKEILSSRLSFQ